MGKIIVQNAGIKLRMAKRFNIGDSVIVDDEDSMLNQKHGFVSGYNEERGYYVEFKTTITIIGGKNVYYSWFKDEQLRDGRGPCLY